MIRAVVLKCPRTGEYFTGNIENRWTTDVEQAYKLLTEDKDKDIKIKDTIEEFRTLRSRIDNSFDGNWALIEETVWFLRNTSVDVKSKIK